MNFLAWYFPVTFVTTLWSMANFQCQVSAECAVDPLAKVPSGEEKIRKYSVVIDAGSSGSRIHVYSWKKEANRLQLPNLLHIFCDLHSPGIPSLTGNSVLKKHVRGLISAAKLYVPESARSETPIYFLGTSGMRLMTERKANEATDFIHQLLKNKIENPFLYEPHGRARILSGEEEGIFSWIATNYLEKDFTTDEETKTVRTHGNLDMNAGSTQIVFAPRGNILANKFPVRLAGTRFNLYVHSYLGYGQDEVAKWIREKIYRKSPATSVDDPCLLKNYSLSYVIDAKPVTFKGKGDPEGCLQLLDDLIYQLPDPSQCTPKPCGIGSAYQPPIQDTKKFYVIGLFLHPLKVMGVLKQDGTFSLGDLKNAAKTFCSTPSGLLDKQKNKTADKLSNDCLTGLYTSLLFEKGFGFKADTTQLQAPEASYRTHIDWTRGCVIYENERLRCDARV